MAPNAGPFSGITSTVIATMLASVTVYLRTWSSYDRLSDSVGNTAYSIFSTEKDHFDFIIGNGNPTMSFILVGFTSSVFITKFTCFLKWAVVLRVH